MKWDRIEWSCAAAYAVASLGLSAVLFAQRADVWRYEYSRAMDGAGLYLFALAPALLACTAISAQRRQVSLAGVDDGLPDRTQAGRSAAWRFGLWGLAVHAAVVLAALAVSSRADAFSTFGPEPLVRPALLLLAAVTLGAMLGTRTGSALVPALVGLLSFALASLSQVGLRELLVVGGGYFDYGFRAWDRTGWLPLLLVSLAGVLLCLPRVRRRLGRAAVGSVAVGALVTGLVLAVVTLPTTHERQPSEHCLLADITVCAPERYFDAAAAVASALAELGRAQPGIVERRFPIGRVRLVSPEAERGPDEIAFDSTMWGTPGAVARSIIDAVAAPGDCDPATQPPANVVASAAIAGWLQRQVDADLDGSYPLDLVARLEALPAPEQSALVDGLLDRLTRCREVALAALDPLGRYS